MSACEHLDPARREFADLPDDERVQWIRAERWISHPAAELALAAVDDLFTYSQRNRMPCLLVHGRTGMGKTMILRKFCRDHPKAVDPRLGLARSPVAMMQLPPKPAEVPFYEELLGADVERLASHTIAAARPWATGLVAETPAGRNGRGGPRPRPLRRSSALPGAAEGGARRLPAAAGLGC